MSGNGQTDLREVRGSQLVITLDYETGQVAIGGKTRTALEAVMMLEGALTEMRERWRAARAAEQIAQPTAEFTAHMRGGRGQS
jgi:hypothetical protein